MTVPVDRPTFSESWYRVADLRPRLRSTVQAYRQHFRGQTWHVVQDPSSSQFFRLNETGYRFVGLLDGQRTVAQAWRVCNEQLGDSAPTQGEAIQLLGQLYTSNLLQAELPPDAEGLFNRYRKRRVREVQGYLTNLLFIRLPLLDPDRFLARWAGVFGRIFTWYGFVGWLILIGVGLSFAVGRWGELVGQTETVFSSQKLANNLPLLYVSFIFIKVFHEFGHAFACKRFGQVTGTGGEVHVMGVMFLVFTPMPYVDASSAWAFRSKVHRIVVGAAGMMVELAVAAVAAIVWASSSQGDVRAITYNIMFIASVSTILFNGNPLLRYDAYYMLSDLLEIPNLSQRSNQYLYYLVRRYAWSVRPVQSPAHTRGERGWFVAYCLTSTAYRVYICVAILLFIADRLFMLGFLLAIAAAVAWVLAPLTRFLRYLATSSELTRVRSRAALTTLLVVVIVVGCVGLIPVPDRYRVEGVVEPVGLAIVHAQADGFVESFLPSGQMIRPEANTPLVRMGNPALPAKRDQLLAECRRLEARKRLAESDSNSIAVAQYLAVQVEAVQEQIRTLEEEISSLDVRAPLAGTWVSPYIDHQGGAYLHRGDRAGLVATLDRVIIRATAEQEFPIAEVGRKVEIRVRGRPDIKLGGIIQQVLPAGQERLPSAALGYAVGGPIPTAAEDRQGTKAAERFFEIRIVPDPGARLLSGQRVVVRFDTPSKPLIVQWWRSLLQLVQRRFQL